MYFLSRPGHPRRRPHQNRQAYPGTRDMNQNETMGRSSGPASLPRWHNVKGSTRLHLLHVGTCLRSQRADVAPRSMRRELRLRACSRPQYGRSVRTTWYFRRLRNDPWTPSSLCVGTRTPVLASLAYDWVSGRYRLDRQAYLVILACHVDALDTAAGLWFTSGHPFALCTRILEASQWVTCPGRSCGAAGTRAQPWRPPPAV